MLQGLEQLLGIDPRLFDPQLTSSDSLSEPDSSCPTSGAIADDVTEVDSFVDANVPVEPERSASNGLMSLLSGKQVKKKLQKKTSGRLESLSSGPELNIDASGYHKQSIIEDNMAELEKKIYSSVRNVSARSLFEMLKKPSDKHRVEVDVESTLTSTVETVEHVEVPDEPEIDFDLIVQSHGKRVAAKDLFASFAPKRIKNSKGAWTLKVRLKIDPKRLAQIKKSAPDATAQGALGPNMLSALMRRKPALKVTLKLPAEFLRETAKSLNPLYTKRSGSQTGKSAKSVFAMMMQTATLNANLKLSPIQKLKGLDPLPLSRELMHVVPPQGDSNITDALRVLNDIGTRPPKEVVCRSDYTMDSLLPKIDQPPHLSQHAVSYKVVDLPDVENYVSMRAPLAFTSPAHERIFQDFLCSKQPSDHSNWPQRFQPSSMESLLIDKDIIFRMKKWFENAFAILKTQSTKTPRNVKIREQQRRMRKREAAMMNFVVEDDEDDDNETEEDIFVPILIIQGASGSCKSASVYAAMNALDGYVHEINTGQQRSRKDLYSSLREFCTSQIIQQKKGVVLFEDCDILFEQDKTFWTVVQDVINFSRRPIIVTVNDLDVVPKSIWELAEEQNSVISMKTADFEHMRQYLWLCSYSERYDLSNSLLSKILRECATQAGYDLRKALMSCQWLCCKEFIPEGKICEATYSPLSGSTFDKHDDLEHIAGQLEAFSVSDVVSANTKSSILHDVQLNELLDIYHIDDSLHLQQPALPFELNIGDHIHADLTQDYLLPAARVVTNNQLRTAVLDFVASRAKKVPKFIQELGLIRAAQTRSRSSTELFEEAPDTQGLPDTSVYFSTPATAFARDLAPFARHWARFQMTIDSMDREPKDEGAMKIETFISWRRFHYHVDDVIRTLNMWSN